MKMKNLPPDEVFPGLAVGSVFLLEIAVLALLVD